MIVVDPKPALDKAVTRTQGAPDRGPDELRNHHNRRQDQRPYYLPYLPSIYPAPERMDAVEFQESNSIVFEWTLRGLKNLFESRWVQPLCP